MPSNSMERLLAEIGNILAEDTDYLTDQTLLYAKVDEGFVAPSIFKDRGNHILYRRPDLNRICEPILRLFKQEPPAKRWAEIEYLIRDGKFDVAFTYPEEIDPEEDPFERRKRVVARYFGDKPIVYPPPPEDDWQNFGL